MAYTRTIIICFLTIFSYGTAKAQIAFVDPTIARHDNACAHLASVLITNSENRQIDDTVGWLADCNLHPTREICEETKDMIRKERNADPLTCGDISTDRAQAVAKAKAALATFEHSSKSR